MPVKMSGKQFKEWLVSDWGPDAMWDEYHYTVDGAEVLDDDNFDDTTIPDAAKVVLTAGTIYLDQRDIMRSATVSAVTHAKKWLKAQTTVTLLVEVPREIADRVESSISQIGVHPGGRAKVVGRFG